MLVIIIVAALPSHLVRCAMLCIEVAAKQPTLQDVFDLQILALTLRRRLLLLNCFAAFWRASHLIPNTSVTPCDWLLFTIHVKLCFKWI